MTRYLSSLCQKAGLQTAQMLVLSFFCVLSIIGTSCTFTQPTLPASSGKTCEILLVSEKNVRLSPIGDSIYSFFEQLQPGLNQEETLFQIADVTLAEYERSDMFKKLRNTLIVEYNSGVNTSFQIFKNSWAAPQMVFKFTVPNTRVFDSLFQAKREMILNTFMALERERIQAVFAKAENIDIANTVQKKFGFRMVVPEGFIIAGGRNNPQFLSLQKETKDYGQSIMIYKFPYNERAFETKNIIALRDSLGKQFIQGPIDSSYMCTEPLYSPISKVINFNASYGIETRGLWRLEGDFMGGPFINYIWYNEADKHLYMLDVFLYSPRKTKRDLLMQLEGIARSAKFPDPNKL